MNRDKDAALEVKDTVAEAPAEAYVALQHDAENAGLEALQADANDGRIGATMFDLPNSEDGTVTVLLPKENLDSLPSQALVRVESRGDGRTYLGAVTQGPFAEPDGLRADATPIVISAVHGRMLMPRHHGRAQIEIIGERLKDGAVVPPRRRPKPNSPVYRLDPKETSDVLRLAGDLRVGMADGFDDLSVSVPTQSKSVLPRHVGIIGTTGGGKSTTVSGTIAKLQAAKAAVILFDTEGEYCAAHEPTTDRQMLAALKRAGMEPAGIPDTHIYRLAGKDAANPKHPDNKQFSLRFDQLSPYALQELLDLTDAQSERFFKAYDITKLALERLKIWPVTDEDKKRQLELDEFESGHPNMKLAHLHDIVWQISAVKDDNDEDLSFATAEFREAKTRNMLKQLIGAGNLPSSVPSWRALLGKLGRMKRLKIFDVQGVSAANYAEMLKPGRVNIVDLSDSDSTIINNLVIAELLRGIQLQQEENYEKAVKAQTAPTPVLIFIEEAHEFLSADRISRMQNVFAQVARIARRGRKRWLGLVFISQLPQHLPDEVLALINNWMIHKIGDSQVVSRLRKSIGGINDGLWKQLPALAPGQAVAAFTSMSRALLVNVDPTPCRLLMVE
jgi:DNA helicase HerA-like ATPase